MNFKYILTLQHIAQGCHSSWFYGCWRDLCQCPTNFNSGREM